jgi:hypothetical protein
VSQTARHYQSSGIWPQSAHVDEPLIAQGKYLDLGSRVSSKSSQVEVPYFFKSNKLTIFEVSQTARHSQLSGFEQKCPKSGKL